MKRIAEEAEVIVRLDFMDKQAHICVGSWPRMAAKMKRMYGESLDKGVRNQSQRWLIPLRCISFRSLGKRTGKVPAQRRTIQRNPEKNDA